MQPGKPRVACKLCCNSAVSYGNFERNGVDVGKMSKWEDRSHQNLLQATFWDQFKGTCEEEELGTAVRCFPLEGTSQGSREVAGTGRECLVQRQHFRAGQT